MADYGAWITDKGEMIDVPKICDHDRFISYDRAFEKGWVALVFGDKVTCIRLNPLEISRKAQKTLLRFINKSEVEDFALETIWCDSFFGVPFTLGRQKIRNRLRQCFSGETPLVPVR